MGILSVVLAGCAAWIAGAVYYTSLGRIWLRVAGIPLDDKGMPANTSPLPFLISGLALMVLSAMMRHLLLSAAILDPMGGLLHGLSVGAFIAVPWIVIGHSYTQRPPLLSVLDGGYAVIACGIIGGVLSALL